MQGILPYLISALLYVAVSVYFWRLHWSAAAITPTASRPRAMERAGVLVALGVHAAVLFDAMLADNALRIGVGDAISAILWLTVLIYWLAGQPVLPPRRPAGADHAGGSRGGIPASAAS